MASLTEPVYTIKIKKRNSNTVMDVTGHAIEVSLVDAENELAYKAEVKLADTVLTDGTRLSSKVGERDTVSIYVNTGGGANLLFYGTVWGINNEVTETNEVKFTVYDPLIYLQKSEAALYFAKNKQTKTIVQSVLKSLGLKYVYGYSSVRHGKIAHRGTYADLIVDTLFESVRKSKGTRGILRWDNGKCEARPEGWNSTYYTVNVTDTGTSVEYATTMDEMVTRVKIVNGKKTKKTVNGDTKTWGVLQQVQDKGKGKISSAKKVAKQTIKDYGKPTRRWKIVCKDIPYVRKGHQIKITGSIMTSAMYIVKAVTHDIHNGTMEMEVARK